MRDWLGSNVQEGGWGMAVTPKPSTYGLAALAGWLALASSGAAAAQPSGVATCPVGQEAHRTAQLFFGRSANERATFSEADFRRFLDQDVTPRFPDGLTVVDGGGQWRGEENHLIREATKVVMVVLPKGRDASGRVEQVRTAYKAKFHQDQVLTITQTACVSF